MRTSHFYGTAVLFGLVWGGVLLAGSFAIPGFELSKAPIMFIFTYGVWLVGLYPATSATATSTLVGWNMPEISPLRGFGTLAAGVGAGIMGLCAASLPAVVMTLIGALAFYLATPRHNGTRRLAQPICMGSAFGLFAMSLLPIAPVLSVSALALTGAVLAAAVAGMWLWLRLTGTLIPGMALLFNPFPAMLALFSFQAGVISLGALIGIMSLVWGATALVRPSQLPQAMPHILQPQVPGSSDGHHRRAA